MKIVHQSVGGERSAEHYLAAVLAKVGGEITLSNEDLARVHRSDIKVAHVNYPDGKLPDETHVWVELGAPVAPSTATTPSDRPLGWNTSIGSNGKAHFYTVTGAPACGERKGIWPGAKLAELFTRPTRPTTDDDHICRYCAKLHPRVCLCWSCKAKRAGAKR